MGVKINDNFDPRFGAPLDSRGVVANIAERDALVSDNRAYEGMVIYVKDNGADLAVMQQYVNSGTVTAPTLEWLTLGGGGGGTGVHNDLTSIQGGLSNTEHYHLTQRQHNWVRDSVPFVAPALGISTNKGPTWAYGTDMSAQEPIILTSTVVVNEGASVKVRLYDVDGGTYLIPDGGGNDLNGYVDFPINGNITYEFPTGTYPVDTNLVSGDTHVYRTDMLYNDLDGVAQAASSSLTYRANAQFIDEIWASTTGYAPDGIVVLAPAPNPTNDPPTLSELQLFTRAQAAVSVRLASTESPPYPTYIVFVVSNDLTGGDSSKIQIKQNGVVVFQDGVTGGTSWTVDRPYTGNTSGSPANPAMTYIQLWTSVNTDQEYQIVIK